MPTVPVSNKADALRAAVEGEKAKVDLSKATWLDKQLVEDLRAAIRERAQVKAKEDTLESHKRDVISQIEVLLTTLGIESALDPRYGSVTAYTQQRSSLNQGKLKEELLKAGMPAETIVRCFSKATTYTESSGLKFTPV
jgi:ATP phosphoribosyltransferase regulatory subunit HisZ